MPDYVTSRLTVHGEGAEQIIRSLCDEDSKGELELDFNKIIPMPKELNIVSGSITDKCCRVYVNSLLEGCPAHTKYLKLYKQYEKQHWRPDSDDEVVMSENEYQDTIKRLMILGGAKGEEPYFETKADMFAYGKKALDNQQKYGARDWYDWRIKHWGTKWNACYTEVNGNLVVFLTAWSDVRDLMRVLSAQYPENTFYYEYAGEEAGFNVGWATYQKGAQVDGCEYDNYSKEAYEQGFELAGGEDAYEFDEEKQNYVYIG